jgi:hypothetical protein
MFSPQTDVQWCRVQRAFCLCSGFAAYISEAATHQSLFLCQGLELLLRSPAEKLQVRMHESAIHSGEDIPSPRRASDWHRANRRTVQPMIGKLLSAASVPNRTSGYESVKLALLTHPDKWTRRLHARLVILTIHEWDARQGFRPDAS